MPAVTLTIDDLAPFATIEEAKANAMIEDALATAARVAPCIITPEFQFAAAAKAIIRVAILRWNDAGTGAVATETLGPYGKTLDTRQPRRRLFWPSEIEDLQDLCRDESAENAGAFSIDTAPTSSITHADICSVRWGADCSCGAILTQSLPLYEW